MQTQGPYLVVIVGETASGKSALAMKIAQKFDGEIICADSRTVYKGMDIGTAKPSLADQKQIPHHMLDVVSPNELFTAADFKKLANQAIEEITARGKVSILVGGTGLYVDSLLYDFQFGAAADGALRQELNELSVDELQTRIQKAGLALPTNTTNPRHLVRVLETKEIVRQPQVLRANTLIIGLSIEREMLHDRIERRIADMFAHGLEREVHDLFTRYGQDCTALQTIGYQEFLPYLGGIATLEEVQQKITSATRQYAKRQRTWFKRNKSIHWATEQIQIVDLVTTFLNK